MKRKCSSCAKKVDRKFNYCPYCGVGFKNVQNEKNFGMLGRDDSMGEIRQEPKLPFGVNKIVGSLMKQLEKQMGDINFNQKGVPKGFKIRLSTGHPQIGQIIQGGPKKETAILNISQEEAERRIGLPKTEAKSKVRRLADRIIYEIVTPGVKMKKDVVVTELASGLEVRAYSKNKCYIKFIPLKVEIIRYYVEDEKVFLEVKG